MGCGVSRRASRNTEKQPESVLRLQSIKTELTGGHLNRANHKFLRLLENQQETGTRNGLSDGSLLLVFIDLSTERQSVRLGSAVERLVQRLVSAIGHMDPRFGSKFLITVPVPPKVRGFTKLRHKKFLEVRKKNGDNSRREKKIEDSKKNSWKMF